MKKTLFIEGSKIEVTFESDKEKIKMNLIKVYDVINKIAAKCEEKGIDTSSWFLKPEQIEEMKKDSKYNFL